MIFTVYSVLSKEKTGAFTARALFILFNWNLYQLIPLVLAIYKASKVTDSAKMLSDIIRKIINSCEDKEVLRKVNIIR